MTITLARAVAALLTLGVVACESGKPGSDTTQGLPPVDTVRPAPVAAPDSVPQDTVRPAPATKTTSTKTTGTKVRDTTRILGRDSVIMPTGKGGLPPIKPDSL